MIRTATQPKAKVRNLSEGDSKKARNKYFGMFPQTANMQLLRVQRKEYPAVSWVVMSTAGVQMV